MTNLLTPRVLAWSTLTLLFVGCVAPDRYAVLSRAEYDDLANHRQLSTLTASNVTKKDFVLPEFDPGFATVIGVSGGKTSALPVFTFTMHPLRGGFEPIGFQALLGGALVGDSGDTNYGWSGGAGITYPLVKNGYLAIGYAHWSSDGDGRDGVYIGLNWGSNPIPTGAQ
jgi:hypothetical protein